MITAAWGDASQATAPSYVFDGSAWSNGYQAAWHFQEMSGLLTTDSTSNNRHLTAEGGATTGTGQVGNGIALDGSNDQLEAIGFKGVTGGRPAPWRLGSRRPGPTKHSCHGGRMR